jgi:transcriptional regulator with XRE-family HTH domain
MAMDETFGDRLRRLRKAQNITQRVLAKRAGTTQGYITDLERSKANNPTMELIGRLAHALDVSIIELSGKTDTSVPAHIQNFIERFSLWLVSKNVDKEIDEEILAKLAKIAEIYLAAAQAGLSTDSLPVINTNMDVPLQSIFQEDQIQKIDIEQIRKLGETITSLTDTLKERNELLSSLVSVIKSQSN